MSVCCRYFFQIPTDMASTFSHTYRYLLTGSLMMHAGQSINCAPSPQQQARLCCLDNEACVSRARAATGPARRRRVTRKRATGERKSILLCLPAWCAVSPSRLPGQDIVSRHYLLTRQGHWQPGSPTTSIESIRHWDRGLRLWAYYPCQERPPPYRGCIWPLLSRRGSDGWGRVGRRLQSTPTIPVT
jgi:hypothetical protein